jgi:hypothetical protein
VIVKKCGTIRIDAMRYNDTRCACCTIRELRFHGLCIYLARSSSYLHSSSYFLLEDSVRNPTRDT